MVIVTIEHEKDSNGNRLEIAENMYADLLASDIYHLDIKCPNNHTKSPLVEIVLAIDEDKKVYIKSYNDYCCNDLKDCLQANLKIWLKF
jgi:hypothetical protein